MCRPSSPNSRFRIALRWQGSFGVPVTDNVVSREQSGWNGWFWNAWLVSRAKEDPCKLLRRQEMLGTLNEDFPTGFFYGSLSIPSLQVPANTVRIHVS